MKEKKPEVKKYGLKEIETSMLKVMIQQHQSLLSNFISFIAIERLAIKVTDKTQFNLASDLSAIEVSESEEESEDVKK